MKIHVTPFVNGRWHQNCYLIASTTGEALIVDPGSGAADIAALADAQGWRPQAILNTHGHYDHVGAVADLMERYDAPFYLHSGDCELLKRANLYRMLFESTDRVRIPQVTVDIASLPKTFRIEPFDISWLPTPGHTEGSICLLVDGVLFSGDTLMKGRAGRTDLPGGNREQLLRSLASLATLRGETVVYGGHGARTTIEAEFAPGTRLSNWVLQ